MPIKLKRIYEDVSEDDGIRILVDRLWPRGVSKQRAQLDCWLKEIGPSNELRKWFGHDPDKFIEFKEKYLKELQSGDQHEALRKLKQLSEDHDEEVSLLFATRNVKHNHVIVLQELMNKQ